jgi:hypothetical protein
MSERQEIEELMHRTRAYWFADGLSEMAMGVIFSLLALLFFWEARIPSGSWLHLVFTLVWPPLIGGFPWLMRRLVRHVKMRYIWPRTGYVSYQYRRSSLWWRKWLWMASIALMGGLTIAALSTWPRLLSLLFSLSAAAWFSYMGYSVGLRRFYLLAAWSLLVGVGVVLVSVPRFLGAAIFWLAVSVGCLASGLCVLCQYRLSLAGSPQEGGSADEPGV